MNTNSESLNKLYLLSENQFKSLSLKEKRLIILEDIMESLVEGIYTPITNKYITPPDSHLDSNIKLNPNVKCEVCAIGGMMISFCKIFNTYTYEEIGDILSCNDFDSLSFSPIKYFSKYQLRLIEDCFEFNHMEGNTRFIPDEEFSSLFIKVSAQIGSEFTITYPSNQDRLLVIIYNMIYNNGIFKPLQELNQDQISSIENLSLVKNLLK